MTTLISFYTKDWKYPQYAAALQRDCERVGIPYKIQCLESTGSYLKNTCLKPQFILDKLIELKSPVLWVDVDASLLRLPVLGQMLESFFMDSMNKNIEVPWAVPETPDFAARRMAEHRDRTWHVGTMWFNYTPAMITFIKRWIENTGNLSDESALERTWQELGETLTTADLPTEYFYIERKGQKPPPGTVIMHRISNSQMKKIDMPVARKKREMGEW